MFYCLFTHSFCNFLESLIFVSIQNIVLVQIQQLELPFNNLVVPDITHNCSRLWMLCMKNIDQSRIEHNSIVGWTFFSLSTVASWWWSFLVYLSTIGPAMFRMCFLDWLSLTVNAPTTVVFQALNRCIRIIITALWNEFYLWTLWQGVGTWRQACIWVGTIGKVEMLQVCHRSAYLYTFLYVWSSLCFRCIWTESSDNAKRKFFHLIHRPAGSSTLDTRLWQNTLKSSWQIN